MCVHFSRQFVQHQNSNLASEVSSISALEELTQVVMAELQSLNNSSSNPSPLTGRVTSTPKSQDVNVLNSITATDRKIKRPNQSDSDSDYESRKEKHREYRREYEQRPHVQKMRHDYYQRPEVRARVAAYRKRPDVRAKINKASKRRRELRKTQKGLISK